MIPTPPITSLPELKSDIIATSALPAKYSHPVGFMYLRIPRVHPVTGKTGFHRVGIVSFALKDKIGPVFALSGSMLSLADPFKASSAQGLVVQRMLREGAHYVELNLVQLQSLRLPSLFGLLDLLSKNSWSGHVDWRAEDVRFTRTLRTYVTRATEPKAEQTVSA